MLRASRWIHILIGTLPAHNALSVLFTTVRHQKSKHLLSGVLYRTKLSHVPTTQYMYVDVHTSYQHALWHVHLCVAHGRPRSHVRSSECLAFNVPACRHWPFVYLPFQLAKFPRQVLFSGVASAWYLCCVFTVTRCH